MSIKSISAFFYLCIAFICLACVPNRKAHHDDAPNEQKSHGLFHIPYFSPSPLNDPVLVLVLHGDAPFSKPSYQYRIAEQIANENDNVVTVGILRPGYTDNEGNRSEGKRGNTTGDNYTREVLEAIQNLAIGLEEKYSPSKIILVGHSGGAAISANLLAEYPDFYAGAVVVACPCDLHEWRAHMKTIQPRVEIWNEEVSSLSPIEGIDAIDDSIEMIVIHGDNDEVVPIDIARKYVEALASNNKKVNPVILEDQGHEIAFDKNVFEAVNKLIE